MRPTGWHADLWPRRGAGPDRGDITLRRMGEGGHIIGPVQGWETRFSLLPSCLWPGGESSFGEDIRPDGGHHIQVSVSHASSLQLILYIPGQTVESHRKRSSIRSPESFSLLWE